MEEAVMNYEICEDCVAKCAHITSRFVYGDKKYIPDPLITVLIPTYRRADFLQQALESVLAQEKVDFFWDILVLDNEPDDGQVNDTERLIRKLSCKRILYYRNSENIRPGDNFNRGFYLSRGKWVMMLHDDDILISNSLQVMGELLCTNEKSGAELGAIVASYIQVEYNAIQRDLKADIQGMNRYLVEHPSKGGRLYQLTHTNIKILGHIGGSVPSNGSTYRREAVLEMGGFNEDFGISGDLILLYNLENKYSVYQTTTPLGFYRWGNNSMMKKESLYRVVREIGRASCRERV